MLVIPKRLNVRDWVGTDRRNCYNSALTLPVIGNQVQDGLNKRC